MNTKFKNTIVTSGFLGCAVVLMSIVSLGTKKINEATNSNLDYLAKTKVTKQTAAAPNGHYLK